MIVPQISFGATIYDNDASLSYGPWGGGGGLLGSMDPTKILISPSTPITVVLHTYSTYTTAGDSGYFLINNTGVLGDNACKTDTTSLSALGLSSSPNSFEIELPVFSGACTNLVTTSGYIRLMWSAGGSWWTHGNGSWLGAIIYDTTLVPPDDGIVTTPQPYAQTYVSNPVNFVGTYNNGINGAYNQIVVNLNNTTYSMSSALVATTTPISATDIPYSFSRNLPLEGNYTYQIKLYDSINATSTPWVSGNNFSLGTSTVATTTPIFAPALECDTFDLACYIKKAFIWLIYPTESLSTSYDGFLDTIQAKPPIGYFTLLANNLGGINASSTPPVDVTIPAHLKTYFFNPFDTALASILWFFFAINFYRRLKHITI